MSFYIFYEFKNKNSEVLFVTKVTSFIHNAKNVQEGISYVRKFD